MKPDKDVKGFSKWNPSNKITSTTEEETTRGGSLVSNSGFNKPEI